MEIDNTFTNKRVVKLKEKHVSDIFGGGKWKGYCSQFVKIHDIPKYSIYRIPTNALNAV